MVNTKKSCPEGKILNPKTNRCIKSKEPKEPKKPKKPKKTKITESKNIIKFYDRTTYGKKLMKKLKLKKKNNYCMNIYIKDDNRANIKYIINDKIILEKEIKTDGRTYIIYLAYYKDNKKDKFLVKIYAVDKYIKLSEDANISKKLSDMVIKDKCPHFPVVYDKLICNNFKLIHNEFESEYKLFPSLIQNKEYQISLLREVYDGNIVMFIEKNCKKTSLIENALVQVFISLMFFYKEINRLYNNFYSNENLIYRKIKPGGYFHYKILDKDYYIENLGYIWMIDEFNHILSNSNNSDIRNEFNNLIKIFTNSKSKFKNTLSNKIDEILKKYNQPPRIDFTGKNLNDFINNILLIFNDYKIIKTEDEIDKKQKIINETPYTIIPKIPKDIYLFR